MQTRSYIFNLVLEHSLSFVMKLVLMLSVAVTAELTLFLMYGNNNSVICKYFSILLFSQAL